MGGEGRSESEPTIRLSPHGGHGDRPRDPGMQSGGAAEATPPPVADLPPQRPRYRPPSVKFNPLYVPKVLGEEGSLEYTQVDLGDGNRRRATEAEIDDSSLLPPGAKIFATDSIVSDGGSDEGSADIEFPDEGVTLRCGAHRHWKVGVSGVRRLWEMCRLVKREGLRIRATSKSRKYKK